MLTRARGVPCPQGETQSPGKTPKGETNPNPNPNPRFSIFSSVAYPECSRRF